MRLGRPAPCHQPRRRVSRPWRLPRGPTAATHATGPGHPTGAIRGPAGFTLIEVLLAVLIFSVLLVAISRTFQVGIVTWRRHGEVDAVQAGGWHALEIMAGDMRNTVRVGVFPWRAAGDGQLEIPVVGPLDPARPDGPWGISRVTYAVDDGALIRTGVVVRQDASGDRITVETTPRTLAWGVEECAWQYAGTYTTADGRSDVVWEEVWEDREDPTQVPRGVRITLTLKDPGPPERTLRLERLVWVPVGTLVAAEEEGGG